MRMSEYSYTFLDTLYTESGEVKSVEKKYYKSTSPAGEYADYCDSKTCHEYLSCKDFKIMKQSFWQVHLFPEVWFYPRDFLTGQPRTVADKRMDAQTAAQMRKLSIDQPDNINYKYYRNPYLSDSASTYISFCFINNATVYEKPFSQRDYIQLSSFSTGTDTAAGVMPVNFDHIPDRMWRVESDGSEMTSIKNALLKLYTTSDSERDFLTKKINAKCINWENIDKDNGKRLWKPDPKDKSRLTRIPNTDATIYTYDGCPCAPIPSLSNFTAAQVRRFVYQAIPTCSMKQMRKALTINYEAMRYLRNKYDQERIQTNILYLNKMIKETNAIIQEETIRQGAAAVNAKLLEIESNCKNSWVNSFK